MAAGILRLAFLGHVQDLLPKNRVWKKEEAALESGETLQGWPQPGGQGQRQQG